MTSHAMGLLALHSDIIAEEQMLMSKSTQSSLYSLPKSAEVIAMCTNYFKVANLKRSKVRIVQSSSFFLLLFLLSSASLAL